MQQTVGIPRALLYYDFFPMWNTFFNYLGVKTVVSPKTNKKILEAGLKNTVDEACLPIKLAMGHVIELAGKVDYIFLPRLVSLIPREYICPKFLGFPDMVRQCAPGTPKLIDVNINLYHPRSKAQKTYREVGKLFSRNPVKIDLAYWKSCKALKHYKKLLSQCILPDKAMEIMQGKEIKPEYNPQDTTIALIGHSYNIYDRYISMNIIGRLKKMGVNVVTADNLSEEIICRETGTLPKKIFWTMGKRMMGAALHFMHNPRISGIICVTSFGCGPDSLIGELIERYLRRIRQIPFLKLTLDEHTGEAGVITRLEAFLDMVHWKARRIGV